MIRLHPEHIIIYLKNKFSSSRAKKSADNLKKIWRGESEKRIDLKLIRAYHVEKCKAGNIQVVDDGTWSDLNMDDFFRFLSSINEIKRKQKSLIVIYENIASLDAAISVASYLNSISRYCKPVFNENNTMLLIDMFHPFIETPVANSFSLENKSCLITGSNMAGKTTFIKTIGVNIILARALGICTAESANIPIAKVKTSIRRQDDLNDNKSYYYKEIESILEFINLSKSCDQYIFLIDEIFRGTNTSERLSSATAVLKHLSQKSINMVTTHDMELQNLLSDKFEMYHFMERIEDDEHFFDYLIKPGPCHSRNAIKLLELMGYPESIIEEALKLSGTDLFPPKN
jgi:DNA mismatch repair ATPase MutS